MPLTKAIEIAFKNIRLRVGRSLLLMSGVALAVAFLASIQTNDAIMRGVQRWIESPHHDRSEILASQRLAEQLNQHGVSTSDAVRRRWVTTLAFLVAFVGIMNAMLMSVSERFREIGTMKCLGALDGFIVKLFLIESLIHGVIGSVVGVIVGLVTAMVSALISYGAVAIRQVPIAELTATLGISVLIGVALCVIGAIVPAWQAGRMQPVEAMRVEA